MSNTLPYLGCTCRATFCGGFWKPSYAAPNGTTVDVPCVIGFKTRAEALGAACKAVLETYGNGSTVGKERMLANADAREATARREARAAHRKAVREAEKAKAAHPQDVGDVA